MTQMRMILTIVFSTTLLLATLVGCNPTGKMQNADGAYTAVRDSFLDQQAFTFYGRTKLLTGDTANGNVVNFSGQKQGEDLLLNVKLSDPDRKRAESMSLLTKGQELFAKTSDSEAWRNVGNRELSLQQELNNWNPVFSFQQIEEMRKSVLPLDDRNRQDNLEAVRVVLDSTKLKSWLAQQMKQQVNVGTQSTHSPRMKLAMRLSDEKRLLSSPGPRVQAAEQKNNIDEIIDQMELEAEYTIYYDRASMLPTSLVMSIRSEYDIGDQRVVENSEVQTYLQDYGKVRALPDPTQSKLK